MAMEIKEAQEKVRKVSGKLEHPRLGSFIALTEEVGEIANEVMKLEFYEETPDNSRLKGEMCDTLFALIELANVYDVDLDAEFQKKLKSLEPRFEEWHKSFGDKMDEKRKKHD